MEDVQTTDPLAPDPYALALGTKLIADGLLLVFDADSGFLVHANEPAIFLLEMSEDGLGDYDFQRLCDGGQENVADLWFALLSGGRSRWQGALRCVLSGSEHPAEFLATLTEEGDTRRVVLHAQTIDASDASAASAAPAGGGDAGALGALAEYLGLIEYDSDGKVLTANERATMALEFYGEDITGRTHESLVPPAEVRKPEYVEFWEKLRQGRIVEGCYRHLTAEGQEVWLQSTYVPLKDDSGMLKRVMQVLMDVTDATNQATRNRRTLEALRETVSMAELDAEGHIVSATAPYCAYMKTEEAKIMGKNLRRFLDPEFHRGQEFSDAWTRVMKGEAAHLDLQHLTGEEKPAWMRAALIPITDESQQVTSVIEIGFDVNDDHNSLSDLRLRYDIINEVMGIFDIDHMGQFAAVNKRFCIMTGGYKEDFEDKEYKMLVPAEIAGTQDYSDFWDRLMNGETISGEFRRRGIDGREVWFHSTYAPLRARSDERVRRVMCISRDITTMKKKETDADGMIRAVERAMGVCDYSPDGTLTRASSNFLNMMGYSLEEVTGKSNAMFCPPEYADSDGFITFWRRLRDGQFLQFVDRRVANGNRDLWLRLSYFPIKNHRGQVERVIEFSNDVTDARLNQVELESKWEAAQQIFAVVEYDPDGKILSTNDGFLRMVGYSAREIVDQHHSIFCTADHIQSQDYRDFWMALAKGETRSGCFQFKARFDREMYLQANYSAVLDALGRVQKVIMYGMDVTDFVKFKSISLDKAMGILGEAEAVRSAQDSGRNEVVALSDTLSSSRDKIANGEGALGSGLKELQGLQEAVKVISDTVATVSEIATQTNLLAFNAAIEAARVGENGEGFSIVADEVRRLAERNTAAAREIATQVRIVTERMESGSEQTETAIAALQSGNATLQDGIGRISGLLSAAESQSARVQELSRIAGDLREGASG